MRKFALYSLICLGCLSCLEEDWYEEQQSEEAEEAKDVVASQEPAIAVAADQLMVAYKANQIAADQVYLKRILVVSGTVESIQENVWGVPCVGLATGDILEVIECTFADSSKGDLAKLSIGQEVVIKGRCDGVGEIMMNVVLAGSSLQ